MMAIKCAETKLWRAHVVLRYYGSANELSDSASLSGRLNGYRIDEKRTHQAYLKRCINHGSFYKLNQ